MNRRNFLLTLPIAAVVAKALSTEKVITAIDPIEKVVTLGNRPIVAWMHPAQYEAYQRFTNSVYGGAVGGGKTEYYRDVTRSIKANLSTLDLRG